MALRGSRLLIYGKAGFFLAKSLSRIVLKSSDQSFLRRKKGAAKSRASPANSAENRQFASAAITTPWE
jgi:hypothetical protein